jgi:integrase
MVRVVSMGWDRGVDYEFAYNKILRHMAKAKYPGRCYDAILLVQLRNGARISEAVKAFKHFLTSKSIEFEVEVSKKKRVEHRKIVVPRELLSVELGPCMELLSIEDKRLVSRLKVYSRYTYGFNTHSLRYAFITHLLRHGVSPSIIAKITKHSRLDYILTYTQEKTAEEILRKLE